MKSAPDPFEDLVSAVSPMTAAPDIEASEAERGGFRSITLARQLPNNGRRYMRLSYAPDPALEDPFNVYTALYGSFGYAEQGLNCDARSWGDLDHIIELARAFLLDLVDYRDVPRFERPGASSPAPRDVT